MDDKTDISLHFQKTYKEFKYLAVTDTGKIRKHNEDSVGIFHSEFGLLVIICDGLGGGLAGEFASKVSVDTIYKSFLSSDEPDWLKRIQEAIESANKFVYEKSNGNLNFKGMATTCEVFLVNTASAYWGHIGDSRIYYFKNGKLNQLTKDHSLIQKLLDEGGLGVKETKNHPRKNVVMKAIGDDKIPGVDSSKMILSNHSQTKFIVCTDGVTCVVSDDELKSLLELDDLNEISSNLINLINGRGAPDNFTFVLIAN